MWTPCQTINLNYAKSRRSQLQSKLLVMNLLSFYEIILDARNNWHGCDIQHYCPDIPEMQIRGFNLGECLS